jgi:hypothetical protein
MKYTLSTKEINANLKNNGYWYWISQYQPLSEDFIRKYQDKVNWYWISKHQHLSEDFIREFKDKVIWYWISANQHLSESFIREFKNKVNWDCISSNQPLSESFIREFKDKVYWSNISQYQPLSESFIREFSLKISTDNWLYKSTEYKKNAIINSKLYKCYKNHFIAYKAIRKDRYSIYNFMYKYMANKEYICHADYTDTENSFGLSVWTEKEVKSYYNQGLIVKVKVYYKDVARLVHESNKVRCSKIKILT